MSLPTRAVDTIVRRHGHDHPVAGHCDGRFDAVLRQYLFNLEHEDEVGSAVCVMLDGQLVVDLWSGFIDAALTTRWQRDTIVNVMSAGKAVEALAVHMLADRGVLDIDAPVARYWPEFAQAGKAKLPLRYVLDMRAGLPIIEGNVPPGALHDWQWMVNTIARQEPLWTPGEKAGYHILTQGFITGEVVRRATGSTLAAFVREEVSRPWGLDFQFGLTLAEQARCAEFIKAVKGTLFDADAVRRDSLLYKAIVELTQHEDFNSGRWRESEISSANGHGNARALARFYAGLVNGGELDGVRLMTQCGVERMTTEQHNLTEVVMNRSYHQALGVLRSSPPIVWMGPNARAFGHHGIGGSIGFGDPDTRLAFAYTTNKMHARIDNGPRAGSLIRAVYDALAGLGLLSFNHP